MDNNLLFLELLPEAFGALIRENEELKEALNRSEQKLNEYKDMDRSIRESIVNAVALGEDYKNNARKEAELIIAEARLRAKQAAKENE
jgi:cell division initiation protein